MKQDWIFRNQHGRGLSERIYVILSKTYTDACVKIVLCLEPGRGYFKYNTKLFQFYLILKTKDKED